MTAPLRLDAVYVPGRRRARANAAAPRQLRAGAARRVPARAHVRGAVDPGPGRADAGSSRGRPATTSSPRRPDFELAPGRRLGRRCAGVRAPARPRQRRPGQRLRDPRRRLDAAGPRSARPRSPIRSGSDGRRRRRCASTEDGDVAASAWAAAAACERRLFPDDAAVLGDDGGGRRRGRRPDMAVGGVRDRRPRRPVGGDRRVGRDAADGVPRPRPRERVGGQSDELRAGPGPRVARAARRPRPPVHPGGRRRVAHRRGRMAAAQPAPPPPDRRRGLAGADRRLPGAHRLGAWRGHGLADPRPPRIGGGSVRRRVHRRGHRPVGATSGRARDRGRPGDRPARPLLRRPGRGSRSPRSGGHRPGP